MEHSGQQGVRGSTPDQMLKPMGRELVVGLVNSQTMLIPALWPNPQYGNGVELIFVCVVRNQGNTMTFNNKWKMQRRKH